MPFAHFLKAFFQKEKKYGSRDRKAIADYCYSAFRLGKAGLSLSPEERILTGYFLSHREPSDLLATFHPEWNDQVAESLTTKTSFLKNRIDISGIFPWKDALSEGIDANDYSSSFLTKPDLFLRIRPGNEDIVSNKLEKAGLAFERPESRVIRLANSAKIEGILEINKEVVVQDISSQHCIDFDWKNLLPPGHTPLRVWDACAASGGKSILLWDKLGPVDLTVSDSRASILANLEKRFIEAGIKSYKRLVADLTRPVSFEGERKFDLIIADVPCTGSGTWGRTPEQLVFFEEERIKEYVALQQKILTNTLSHLKPGGLLVYITCSVFRAENEKNVKWLEEKFSLTCLGCSSIEGYTKRGDSLFSGILRLD